MSVSYKRLLVKGMSGTDVRYMKDCLFSLGMYPSKITKISNSSFGSDTLEAVKKYQKGHNDVDGKKLSVDGIIGKKSWTAIERDYENLKGKTPKYTRLLRRGMSGDDVWYMKNLLFELNYYSKGISKITNKTFGNDTVTAVKSFQGHKNLMVDGIIGPITWSSIEESYAKSEKKPTIPITPIYLDPENHKNLSKKTIDALNAAWQGISSTRISLMKKCIEQAYDTVNGTYHKGDNAQCLYIIGADLYNKSCKLFHPTASYVKSRAKSRPDYFTGGRKDWMLGQIALNPDICATDCSGMIVGVERYLGLCNKTFDATANNLAGSRYSSQISKSQLIPADWVWKPGHIGVYLGAGLVVEAAGGAYGVQITKLDSRKCRNLITGKLESMSEWTGYRRPKSY